MKFFNKKILVPLLGLTIIALLTSSLFKPLQNFPAPTGNYGVGTTNLSFLDNNRIEKHSKNGAVREFVVQVWYPAKHIEHQKFANYIPPQAINYIKNDLSTISKKPLSSFNYLDKLLSPAFENIPVAEKKFPVIIFEPGFGAPVYLYTSLCTELASHGYIVMALSHPYVTNPTIFPDGRIITQAQQLDKAQEFETWLHDVKFLIQYLPNLNVAENQPVSFKNRLNLTTIILIGHSFGAAVSLQACNDTGILACIDLDGKLRPENTTIADAKKPILLLLADRSDEASKKETAHLATFLAHNNVQIKTIQNARHESFTDYNFIMGNHAHRAEVMKNITSKIIDFLNKQMNRK